MLPTIRTANDMFDQQADAKSALTATAAILQEVISLYDRCGLSIASAHLSAALDAACRETGVDRADLASPFGKASRASGDIN